MIDFLQMMFFPFMILCSFVIIICYFNDREDRKWNRFWSTRKDLALSCPKCGKLAAPILCTGNRYRCPCGNQFAGDYHNLKIPGGTPPWYRKNSGSPHMTPGDSYYEKELDPLSDSFDPQKDLKDTRFWKEYEIEVSRKREKFIREYNLIRGAREDSADPN